MPTARKKDKSSFAETKQRAQRAAQITAQQQQEAKQAKQKRQSRKKETAKAAADAPTKTTRSSARKKESTKEADSAATHDKPQAKEKKKFSWSSMGRKSKIALCILLVLVIIIAILYSPLQNYYQSLRKEQHQQAILDAYTERNDTIKQDNEALKTDEGISAKARNELGWVEKGDNAVIVDNADSDSENAFPDQVDEDSIHAPSTWYYTILDAIFFVSE